MKYYFEFILKITKDRKQKCYDRYEMERTAMLELEQGNTNLLETLSLLVLDESVLRYNVTLPYIRCCFHMSLPRVFVIR